MGKGGEKNQGFTALQNNKIVDGPSRKEKKVKIPPSRLIIAKGEFWY